VGKLSLVLSRARLLKPYREGMDSECSHMRVSHVDESYSISHVSESHDTRITRYLQQLVVFTEANDYQATGKLSYGEDY